MAALALVTSTQPQEFAAQETNKVYAVIADGKRIGMSVACDEHVALGRAVKLLTRGNDIDEGETGYRMISVKRI